MRKAFSGFVPAIYLMPLVLLGLVASFTQPATSQIGGGRWLLPFYGGTTYSGPAFWIYNLGSGGAICGYGPNNFGVRGDGYYGTWGQGVYGLVGIGSYDGAYHSGSTTGSENYGGSYGSINGGGYTGAYNYGGPYGSLNYGSSIGAYGASSGGYGAWGATGSGIGVLGTADNGVGVWGNSNSNWCGLFYTTASGTGNWVLGSYADNGVAVYGHSNSNWAGLFQGTSSGNWVLSGQGDAGVGVYAYSNTNDALYAYSNGAYPVWAQANAAFSAVVGWSPNWHGVYGYTGRSDTASAGVLGINPNGHGTWGGYFYGDLGSANDIYGAAKHFKIDHPLDPANKYLIHADVESSEMLTMYTGNAILDADGKTWVDLPNWFESLNRDFRYQLTAIGASGPGLYVAQEISGNRFQIAGGTPGMKVSWQVTGVRQDAYAKAHPMQVEVDKGETERGLYLHPKEHGVSAKMGIGYDEYKKMQEHAVQMEKQRPTTTAPKIIPTSAPRQ